MSMLASARDPLLVRRWRPVLDRREPAVVEAESEPARVEVEAEVSRPADGRRGRQARPRTGATARTNPSGSVARTYNPYDPGTPR